MCLTTKATFILDFLLPLPCCLTGFVRGARTLLRNFIFAESPGRQSLKEKPPQITANPSAVHTVYRNMHFAVGGQFLILPLPSLGAALLGHFQGFV